MAGFLSRVYRYYIIMKMRGISFEYKITAIYILLGGLWIMFSDELVAQITMDPQKITALQTFKGWFYVALTSVLFFIILRKHLTRIRLAERKAKESDTLKTAFLRNISHEIRTPMNSIIGFSTLLNENNLPGNKKEEYLSIIKSSSVRLLEVVNEILDISMLQTGNLDVVEKKTDLNRILVDVYDAYKPHIKGDIDFRYRKGLNQSCVLTDEMKVRKVLSGIVSNASKFTETGQILFGYEVSGDDIRFFVKDTGTGISEENVPNVFDSFQKSDKSGDMLYEGLGLGLAICKGNIDLLKGKIWVQSEQGKGTSVFFTIPFKACPEDRDQK